MDTDPFEPLLRAQPQAPSLGELDPITEKIIGCAYTVANALGCGFLERVYENALVHELRKADLQVSQQQPIQVLYDNVLVGSYEADLIVEGRVLVEIKAVRDLSDVYRAQCLNYLKATGLRICLLINFGNARVQIKRIVL